MNFVTLQYCLFFVFVFVVYWHLPRKPQNLFLLVASWYFYASWNYELLSLIIISTVIDFIAGPRIYDAKNLATKRFWLIVSLTTNLGILAYFKYANFFVESFAAMATSAGFPVSHTTLNIVLPVGISFYTFQSLSYSLDIYRGQLKPTRSFIDFAAFVAFFPQLVAGPIVRAKEFLFQLDERRTFSMNDLEVGLTRFVIGFFKKAFIADNLAVYLVDPVFSNPGDYSTGMLWLAMFGYAIQIYADFSGYSDMAIGSARMLGFRLPENFNYPYLATSISDFWRRWHMTMSRFFRDYIYISLGGNRVGYFRTLVNLALTTLTSGLWHGAAWTFVAWGGLHGIFTALNHVIRGVSWFPGGLAIVLCGWVLTQLFVCFAWVLFRAADFGMAWTFITGLFVSHGTQTIELPPVLLLCVAGFLIDYLHGWLKEHRAFSADEHIPVTLRAGGFAVMILIMFHGIPQGANPFIYFQF